MGEQLLHCVTASWVMQVGGRNKEWGERERERVEGGLKEYKKRATLDCSLALTPLQFNWSALTTAIILNSLQMFSRHTREGCKESPITQK